ncbi:MAG TPA: 3-dehydroquinate synthase, partial [Actinomycetes bacterium]|nr:3-dehydroquinate synthase [Actinomycetes bacterium]
MIAAPTEPTPGSRRITVAGPQRYDVVVGTDLLGELPGLLPAGTSRVAVLHPVVLRPTAGVVEQDLAGHGYQVQLIELPAGESAK